MIVVQYSHTQAPTNLVLAGQKSGDRSSQLKEFTGLVNLYVLLQLLTQRVEEPCSQFLGRGIPGRNAHLFSV